MQQLIVPKCRKYLPYHFLRNANFTCLKFLNVSQVAELLSAAAALLRLIDDPALKFNIKRRPLQPNSADGSRDNGIQIVWKHGKLKQQETHHKNSK